MRTGIVGFIAKRGEGKTLLMTIFGYIMAVSGSSIYANYTLYGFPKKNPPALMDTTFYTRFFSKEDRFAGMRNIFMLIDELPTYLDAYEQLGKKNKVFSNFVRQTRKRDVHLFYTAQQLNLIPKRIRQNTDAIIMPHYDATADTLRYEVFAYNDRDEMKIDYTATLHGVSRFFALYDTNEIVQELDI